MAGVLGQEKVRTYQDIVCNWSMAKMTLLGVRAITMQQPFASAMVAGEGLYTRCGRTTAFQGGDESEWVAIHCGGNHEHVNNAKLMTMTTLQGVPGCIPGVQSPSPVRLGSIRWPPNRKLGQKAQHSERQLENGVLPVSSLALASRGGR